MTPENFCYWLQGRIEDRDLVDQPLTLNEQLMIKDHLELVFTRHTPDRTGPELPLPEIEEELPELDVLELDRPNTGGVELDLSEALEKACETVEELQSIRHQKISNEPFCAPKVCGHRGRIDDPDRKC